MTMLGSLRYRLLAVVALVVCLIALMAPAASPQSTSCCSACLKRWQQCDANDVVCCQIYTSCIQQCQGGCQSCPQ